MESVRPSTTNEEDLQLQLALAMSKEEHDEEIKKRKGDEIKLQMAIEESKKTAQQEVWIFCHLALIVVKLIQEEREWYHLLWWYFIRTSWSASDLSVRLVQNFQRIGTMYYNMGSLVYLDLYFVSTWKLQYSYNRPMFSSESVGIRCLTKQG